MNTYQTLKKRINQAKDMPEVKVINDALTDKYNEGLLSGRELAKLDEALVWKMIALEG